MHINCFVSNVLGLAIMNKLNTETRIYRTKFGIVTFILKRLFVMFFKVDRQVLFCATLAKYLPKLITKGYHTNFINMALWEILCPGCAQTTSVSQVE